MAGTVGINFSIGAALGSSVASAFGTVSSRVKGLRADLKGLESQSKAAARLSASQMRLQTVREKYAADPTDKMRAALRTAVREFGTAHRAARQYGIGVGEAGRAQEMLTQRIERTHAALTRQQRLQANQAKRKELQGEVMGIGATALAMAAPIKLAIDYEGDFADLKKVADFASKEQEKRVQQDIFAVARRSGISASGMTKIAAAAAESGAANDANKKLDPEKLKQFLNDAAEMSVAYGISAEEAGERLATLQGRMELTPQQTKAMGDAMNYIASKTNATAAATLNVVARMGGVGQAAGLSEKSLVGLAAAFVSTSESQETAGTAMKSFLSNLIAGENMTKGQKDIFKKIGLSNVKGLAEGMKKGGPAAENTIMTVLEAIRKMPEAEQAGIAKEIFGLESFASVAPLINNPKKLLQAFRLANSDEATGSQLREFETRANTTQGAIDRLKTSMGILGITVGSVLLPPLAGAAEIAATVVKPITALAERFPTVTKVVMMTGIALVALKVASLGGAYAATMLSDGWTIAKSSLAALRSGMIGATAVSGTSTAAMGTQAAASGLLAKGFRGVGVALRFAFGPVGRIISLVALGIGWLWENCETFRTVVTGLGNELMSIPSLIGEAFSEAMSSMGKSISDFFDSIPGMSSVKKHASSAFTGLGKMLGFGDDEKPKDAPTSADSTKAPGGVGSAASAAKLSPAQSAQSTAAASQGSSPSSASGRAMASAATSSGGGSIPGGMTFNLNFSINGVTDGDFASRVMGGLKSRKGELESIIADIIGEQKRLAYGS